jgi:nicotinate-nucleotide pyrophosphorylase (carboxylating)
MVAAALAEDVGPGDLTAEFIDESDTATASVIGRTGAIVCGIAWFDEVYRQLDHRIKIEWLVTEGEHVAAEATWCRVEGPARDLLTGERTGLNFLQTLSGTATRTRHYVDQIEGTGCRLLDTRKTIPGLRVAQKYAVRIGGGTNHRIGLYDGILIKENHIRAAGSLRATVTKALTQAGPDVFVEVEVETLDQLVDAIDAGAPCIMLDNFDLESMRKAVEITAGRATLEASGGVQETTLRAIAETGVDFASVGDITKNLTAVDLSMQFERE